MKWLKAVLASTLYLVVLITLYWLHVRFARVDVVFYSALEDVLAATVFVAVLLFVLRSFNIFTVFEKTQLVVIWALMGYALAISVPTVLDRSLSFYILEKLQQRGGGILYSAFETVFTQEYAKEHHLVDVRLTEQLKSGTVVMRDGCVMLTPKGDSLARFSRWFRKNLLPRQRLLMGQYSDVLIDPLSHSAPTSDDRCPDK
jgi:hypothetical protein